MADQPVAGQQQQACPKCILPPENSTDDSVGGEYVDIPGKALIDQGVCRVHCGTQAGADGGVALEKVQGTANDLLGGCYRCVGHDFSHTRPGIYLPAQSRHYLADYKVIDAIHSSQSFGG